MILKGEDADLLLQIMDGGVPDYHMKYRRLTHKRDVIPKLALILSLCADDEETNYLNIYTDMMRHIDEDAMFNKLIYGGAKNRKEESNEDKDKRNREIELLRELAE